MDQATDKEEKTMPNEGHVYVLISPNCEFIKIGGTDFAPMKRIKEINSVEPYKGLGPWSLVDFRQVTDWRVVEYNLHFTFRSKQVKSIEGQKELFAVSSVEASRKLADIDPVLVTRKPKVDRMFQDEVFFEYITKLFRVTGILNWLDIQGAWTFSLFPSTNGGRYFTLNIGTHEVAFSTTPQNNALPVHMVHMDRLIHDFPTVGRWITDHGGELVDDNYASALPRSTSVFFSSTFEEASSFFSLNGVRRALIAYWSEGLIGLQEKGSMSVHTRHHNWNAVAEIRKRSVSN